MQVVFEPTNVRKGLDQLRATLKAVLPKPIRVQWSFPGASQDDVLLTWEDTVEDLPFTIAIGKEGYWGTRRKRTPILIARTKRRNGMTPTVEINIPSGDGRVNRNIGGCLCQGADKRFLLAHRGQRVTTTPSVIPKETIHQYFSSWLRCVTDDDRKTQLIPVGYVDHSLISRIADFADQVAALKRAWGGA